MIQTKQLKQFSKHTLIALLLTCFNCSSFLEQEPGSQTSITELLDTTDGVVTALNGAYHDLEANVRGERYATYADMQAGNITFTPTETGNNTGQITVPFNIENVYNFTDIADDSNLDGFYDDSYDIINQTNLILEYVNALTDSNDNIKNQIRAEALTIRAYVHFILSQVYAQNYGYTADASHLGLVYSKTTLTNGITYPSRETLATTYDLIIDDLTSAINNYSNTLLLDGPTYSYFNKVSTQALLARVYISKYDWQNAYDLANEVILNSGKTLTPSEDYIAEWEKTDLPISEVLLEFSIPRDTGGTVGGSLSSSYGFTSTIDYADYVASEDLLNLFETNDLRGQLFLETNLPTLIDGELEDRPYYFTKKFQDNPGFVAIRLSEMYLIRAEASLGLENLEDCKDDINILRNRANATLLTETTNLEDALLLERRKEMCFEAQYLFDLARFQQNIVRGADCVSQTCNLIYPSGKYILPIPDSNIELNSNLQQNDTY
ncbi:SusD family protein [Algibacter lectus]|uniref:RagB/SusD family nutrient uptake outer membrane protein n=1 Tax=Algibacter lectus TaxID=221126 RepID=UPI0008F34F20|nr:RagB/SusD family nutrient uptake outer membrane protein [Algibacter lectus]SFC79703.1 SusD family protein [Algibacter lectus]